MGLPVTVSVGLVDLCGKLGDGVTKAAASRGGLSLQERALLVNEKGCYQQSAAQRKHAERDKHRNLAYLTRVIFERPFSGDRVWPMRLLGTGLAGKAERQPSCIAQDRTNHNSQFPSSSN